MRLTTHQDVRRAVALMIILRTIARITMTLTNYERNRIQDVRYGGSASYTKAATVYIALFTAAPSVTGGGTEVTGGSYARVAVTNDATNWPNAVAGLKGNAVALTFAQATASWGTVTHMAIFDAPTGGNMQEFATLAAAKTVQNGDVVQFGVNSIQMQAA